MTNLNKEKKYLCSFDKSFSAEIFFNKPSKYRDIERLSNHKGKLISEGSNLSYTPLSFEKGSLSINLKRFNRIINFNLKKKEITVEAGITLAELLNFTLKHNLWLPQLPGYPLITLGGAVATNAHGKSCQTHGTIRNAIKNILIFHSKNGWLNLSELENKEIFDLTIGGIGLTGSIINITLKLKEIKSKSFITKKIKTFSIEDCIKNLEIISKKKNSFIYSWNMADNFEDFGKGFIFENIVNENSSDKHDVEIPNFKVNNYIKSRFAIWNKFSIKLANRMFFILNKIQKNQKKEDFLKVIFPFYGKEIYFDFFGKKGFLESQILISPKNMQSYFDEFKYFFKTYKPDISLFSLKYMSGEQKYLRFEDNKICITFDYINNKKNLLFMEKIDSLNEKYKATPSIIKDSRLSKKTVEKCYPEFNKFKDLLNDYDKNRIYRSEISKRLEI